MPGLKRELAKSLMIAWAENQAVRQTMIFLQGYGVSSKMAARIYQHYGYNTITTVKENPLRAGGRGRSASASSAPTPSPRAWGIDRGFAQPHSRRACITRSTSWRKKGMSMRRAPMLVDKCAEMLAIDNTERIQEVLSSELFTN